MHTVKAPFQGINLLMSAKVTASGIAAAICKAQAKVKLYSSNFDGMLDGASYAAVVGIVENSATITMSNDNFNGNILLHGNGYAAAAVAYAAAGTKLELYNLIVRSYINENRALKAGSIVAFIKSGATVSHNAVGSLTSGQYCACGTNPLSEVRFTPAACTSQSFVSDRNEL